MKITESMLRKIILKVIQENSNIEELTEDEGINEYDKYERDEELKKNVSWSRPIGDLKGAFSELYNDRFSEY
jgi:hypothetical protein